MSILRKLAGLNDKQDINIKQQKKIANKKRTLRGDSIFKDKGMKQDFIDMKIYIYIFV